MERTKTKRNKVGKKKQTNKKNEQKKISFSCL